MVDAWLAWTVRPPSAIMATTICRTSLPPPFPSSPSPQNLTYRLFSLNWYRFVSVFIRISFQISSDTHQPSLLALAHQQMSPPYRTGDDSSSRRHPGTHRSRASGGNRASSSHPAHGSSDHGGRATPTRYGDGARPYDLTESHTPSDCYVATPEVYDGATESSHHHPISVASGRNAGDGNHPHSSGQPSSRRYPPSPGSRGLEDNGRITSRSEGRSDGDAHGADNRNSGRPSSMHYPLSPGSHGLEGRGYATSRFSRHHDVAYDHPAIPPAVPASPPHPRQRVPGAHIPGWSGRVYSPGTLPSDNRSAEELRRFEVRFKR